MAGVSRLKQNNDQGFITLLKKSLVNEAVTRKQYLKNKRYSREAILRNIRAEQKRQNRRKLLFRYSVFSISAFVVALLLITALFPTFREPLFRSTNMQAPESQLEPAQSSEEEISITPGQEEETGYQQETETQLEEIFSYGSGHKELVTDVIAEVNSALVELSDIEASFLEAQNSFAEEQEDLEVTLRQI